MKKATLLLLCMIGLLLWGCEEVPPDYVGYWVDDSTLAEAGTTVFFDLEADEATITIDNTDSDDVVITGTLKKSGSTLTTTIIEMTIGTDPPLDGPGLEAFLLTEYGLTPVNSFTYLVSGDTLFIQGALIFSMTGEATDTLVAMRI